MTLWNLPFRDSFFLLFVGQVATCPYLGLFTFYLVLFFNRRTSFVGLTSPQPDLSGALFVRRNDEQKSGNGRRKSCHKINIKCFRCNQIAAQIKIIVNYNTFFKKKSFQKKLKGFGFYDGKFYSNNVNGCSRYILNVCKNCAPVAPSITLWSQARESFIVFPTTI